MMKDYEAEDSKMDCEVFDIYDLKGEKTEHITFNVNYMKM